MVADFKYVFPSIRGIQAHREYYVSMCPLRLIPKLFLFDEDEIVPELRAQRNLNRSRVPEMARYLTQNPEGYVFSAITASIDGEVHFDQFNEGIDIGESKIGYLHISMDAKFVINDGQHRRAAIQAALGERPELGDETIAVVFFLDVGLERCQQMFADLNRYAIRPSTSLGILYDHRDDSAKLVKHMISKSLVFRNMVEMEKTTLSARSLRLFTLSAIYHATGELLKDIQIDDSEEKIALAIDFWEEAASNIKEWGQVSRGEIKSSEVRMDFLHTYGVALQGLARAGNTLIRKFPEDWKRRMSKIRKIDWRKSNISLWDGRAMIAGRVSKGERNVSLTANAIKKCIGVPLSPDEQRLENAFLQSGQDHEKT
ncbi:MAG: DNA sulfur modification protein DndB [Gammaproteobacteria bacterium]|nr:DNA sulfur modification protein DndB [Gammaproteobacteria bacterium]MCY4228472.1 DNA sulfur modification protein DndB [Gammaproteobacteria bacterium]